MARSAAGSGGASAVAGPGPLGVGGREGGLPVVEALGVSRVYHLDGVQVRALDGVDLVVEEGDSIAIMGPSGSGKSTLLGLLGGLDRPTWGTLRFSGRDITRLTEDERASVGQEDTPAGSCRPRGNARVLALHTHRGGLLAEPRLVRHHPPARVTQVLHHVGAPVVAEVRVPVGGGEKPLHPIGGALRDVLGQLPAVPAPDRAQQPRG
jgi:ABC transporter